MAWQATKPLFDQAAAASESNLAEAEVQIPPLPPPRENAVLVFGARGRLGKLVVEKLLAAGRTVVAAVRDKDRAVSDFSAMGLEVSQRASPFEYALYFKLFSSYIHFDLWLTAHRRSRNTLKDLHLGPTGNIYPRECSKLLRHQGHQSVCKSICVQD